MDRHPSTTVLYIAGFGRSGSTLLERLMDQLPGFVSVGEAIFLWERGVLRNEHCGCGSPFWDCPFWTAVGARAFGGWDRIDAAHVVRLLATVEHHRNYLGRVAPALAPELAAAFGEYTADYLVPAYAAVAEVAGATVVVDSSKRVSMAFLLRQAQGIDLRVAHAVRDPQGVAFSWAKHVETESPMPRYSPAVSTAWWLYANTSLRLLPLAGVPTEVVRYEDLVLDTTTVVQRLARLAGFPVDDPSLPFIGADKVHLAAGHSVAGNPMRFRRGAVALQEDDAWRQHARRRDRLVVAAMAAACPSPSVRYRAGVGRGAKPSPLPVARGIEPVSWPSVTSVIPTRDRPELLERAVASVLAQDYPGDLEVVVVFDQTAVDHGVTAEAVAGDRGGRRVRALANRRQPGLAGARNTGVAAATGELVAFCDDDDEWLPHKLREQVRLLHANPAAAVATSGIIVTCRGRSTYRRPDRDIVVYEDLLRSRLSWAHSSTLLVRRQVYEGVVGWVDEGAPGGFAEDYEWLLRAARTGPLVASRKCLTRVHWSGESFFSSRWEDIGVGLRWLLERHPDLRRSRAGHGRILGQIAFAEAASGRKGDAWRTATRTLATNPGEPRAVLALAVASGLIGSETIVAALNRRGRGV